MPLNPSHLLASLAQSSQFGLIVFDREYRYLYWSKTMEAISGMAAEHVIGAIAPEIFPFLRETGEVARFDEALSGQTVISARQPFRTSAGHEGFFDAEYLPIRNDQGEVVAALGLIRDTTDFHRAKMAELAFAESESRFRAVADVATSAIYIHDGKRMLYVNKATEEISGYSLAEILEMDMWALVHPDDLHQARDRAAARFRGDGDVPKRYEYRIIHRSGQVRWLDFSAAPAKLGDTPVIVACAFDVTERKQAEAALIQSERLAAAGRMAATIAHELNNPLEAVTNLIYLIQQSGSIDERTREYARMADAELARASHIAKQTLAFYRDSGQAGRVQTQKLLEEVLGFYRPRAHERGVMIELESTAEHTIQGHAGELKQVFSNLLLNALDATPAGGRVKIRIRSAVQVATGRRGIRITVADTGCGIPPRDRAKIFEAFFTTKGQVGTGLGLWVTAGIIHKHEGTIRMRSRDAAGQSGTCFSIFLPLEHSGEPVSTASSSAA